MPKRKQFLGGDKKKGKQAPVLPTTADEYLEAGVDLQEAGEKWRAGDAIKSVRFFTKALDTYEEGLKKFPTAFDIAYNKAQIQYQFTQYPKLIEQLPVSLLDLLQIALQSSKYALSLNGENADVLFNTAQILGSLAEAAISSPGATNLQPLPLLEEALVLFQRCLGIQEAAYAASLKQAQSDTDMEDGGVRLSSAPDESSAAMESSSVPSPSASMERVMQEEQWVTIVDQTTPETLIDTMTAQLDILIMLCGIANEGSGADIQTIQKYGADILSSSKLPALLAAAPSEVSLPASVTVANFHSSIADASYNSNRISSDTYWKTIDSIWPKSGPYFSQDFSGLTALAEAMIAFNDSLRTHSSSAAATPSSSLPELLARWQALSRAQESLTQAVKLPGAVNTEKIHLLRGDVDILRFQLGRSEVEGAATLNEAVRSGPVLCKNAEKYYRGARKTAEDPSVGNDVVVLEAAVKEGIARELGGEAAALRGAVGGVDEGRVKAVLEEAVEGGVVRWEQLRGMGVEL